MEHLTDKRKETNWCVYMHENRVNGKKYIGITSQKPTSRWSNGQGYTRTPLFYNAIQKYGWDAFRHEILYTSLTQDDAERLEIELIAKYQTQDPEKGYNLADGGSVNAGFHRTEDFKRRLSATRTGLYSGERHSQYGTHKSESTKDKIRAAQAGAPKDLSARERMSAAAKNRWSTKNTKEREHYRQMNTGANSPVARAVVCVDTGERYPSISEASAATGAELTGIVRCCKEQRHTAGGLRWRYAEVVSGG